MIQEIRVATKSTDIYANALLSEIKRTLGIHSISAIRTAKIYRFQGIDESTATYIAAKILVDPLDEVSINNQSLALNAQKVIEIGNKPGVMNPEVESLFKTVHTFGINATRAVDVSREYYFFGDFDQQELSLVLDKLLINKTVNQLVIEKPLNLMIEGTPTASATIAVSTMSDVELKEYARNNQLYLNDSELTVIRDYFKKQLRDPRDAELETIAQTWSEHCSHKTFRSPIIVDGQKKSSLFSRLKNTALNYQKNVLSAFVDNGGVFSFYDGWAIAGKVETHNSPSAIEPYGGAATGSGGVFRDIMGTGLGAQVIASTDIFCFAQPTMKQSEIPPGCLHPDYLMRNVVAGVRDYGNRMGIPTNNGSFHFHPDFRAKPTVIVGAYGLIPEAQCKKGKPREYDRIFVLGGKTGRDGIHGATFSSDAMTHETISVNATAVQIGNAIEQKRMADALLAARNADVIQAITDCGAGGFSSAIGEMGADLGVHVQLEKVPLKYLGLSPWEIWISESQERMICAIAPEHVQTFNEICQLYNVLAADIGYFTKSKRITVMHENECVVDLETHFLFEEQPLLPLVAQSPTKKITTNQLYNQPTMMDEWRTLFCAILQHGNICSKEPIARQYDHSVQAMNALPSFSGNNQSAPQNAALLVPLYGKPYGLIISHGLNPILNTIDPYAGSVWAITEALANLVAVGGNVHDAALIDNFIWPKPTPEKLWALDRSMQACIDAMNAFGLPFISGKDSLSSTYNYPHGEILEIPPVLCISVFGKIPDVSKRMTTQLKKNDSLLLLIGNLDVEAMGGSVYEQILKINTDRVPTIDLRQKKQLFEQLYALCQQQKILACHDVSEGGIAVTLAEMCFGGQRGAVIDIGAIAGARSDWLLFNETAGCFIIEVTQENYKNNFFNTIDHKVLGRTQAERRIVVQRNDALLFDVEIQELFDAWQKPMKEVFCV